MAVKSRFLDIISIQWTDFPQKSQKSSSLLALLINELAEYQYNLAGHEDKIANHIVEFLHANHGHFYTGEELTEQFFVSLVIHSSITSDSLLIGTTSYQERINPKYELDTKLFTMFPKKNSFISFSAFISISSCFFKAV